MSNSNPLIGTRPHDYGTVIEGDVFLVPYLFDFIKPQVALFRCVCCDCGLVHDYEFTVGKKGIEMRAWRNNRATARRRNKEAKP